MALFQCTKSGTPDGKTPDGDLEKGTSRRGPREGDLEKGTSRRRTPDEELQIDLEMKTPDREASKNGTPVSLLYVAAYIHAYSD